MKTRGRRLSAVNRLSSLFIVELLAALWRDLRHGFRRRPMRDAHGYAISAEKLKQTRPH
jgi:hypothetical protein